jgi:hypothetical protein
VDVLGYVGRKPPYYHLLWNFISLPLSIIYKANFFWVVLPEKPVCFVSLFLKATHGRPETDFGLHVLTGLLIENSDQRLIGHVEH